MKKLPNPEQTLIDYRKLVDYCLNPEHPEGQHKAAVFKTVLNLECNDKEILKKALLQAVRNNLAIPIESNQYGQKYLLEFEMTHQHKTAIIKSVWIVRHNEDFARLVTCYILREKK